MEGAKDGSGAWSGDVLTLIGRPDGAAWELTYDPAKNGNRPGYLTQLRLLSGALGRVEAAFEYDVQDHLDAVVPRALVVPISSPSRSKPPVAQWR